MARKLTKKQKAEQLRHQRVAQAHAEGERIRSLANKTSPTGAYGTWSTRRMEAWVDTVTGIKENTGKNTSRKAANAIVKNKRYANKKYKAN